MSEADMDVESGEMDYEAEARRQGWAPEEEWKGDNKPDKFLTAKEFVERGKEINGHLKRELAKQREEMDELRASNAEIQQFYQKTLERERAERDQEIARLKKEREEAIDSDDLRRYTQADDKIKELEKADAGNTGQPTEDLDPSARQWLSENTWYETNTKLATFADGVADRIRAQGFRGQAYWSELTRQVRENFPEEFEAPRPPAVEGGKVSEASSTARTYDNLPAEAKAQCERFMKTIDGFTKDDYLENYDWDE